MVPTHNYRQQRSFTIVLLVFVLNAGFLNAQQLSKADGNIVNSIIPKPLQTTKQPGKFKIDRNTKISVDGNSAELSFIAGQLSQAIKQTKQLNLPVSASGNRNNAIFLTLQGAQDSLGSEGYTLKVRDNGVTIAANNGAGLFYGTQTLYQLLTAATGASSAIELPAVDIVDKPRFAWRGLMLDVGRFFYPVDFLKRFIDNMARHKLNTFHWHLTEDHGWRVEIKKHPELTKVGAGREGTQFDRSPDQVNRQPHWGYYTQEQMKELVAYAQKRYVTIVPEIEMPGHTLAALVANPQLSCTGGPFKMPVQWAIQKDIYCAGNDETFSFLQDVLTEVAEIFPSPVIHIGGDEAPKDRWKACAKCQQRIKDNGLKDEHELQSYFVKRIEKFLQTKNKKIIGWDEILEGGLAPNAWVMSWRGTDGGIAAAKQGHNVVMSPYQFMYLDYYQGEPYLEPVAFGNYLPLNKVYSYEPVPSVLTKEESKYIQGVQANIWGEYIHSEEKVEYMTFPRASAVAEVGWTEPQLKDWKDFTRRMEYAYKRYELEDVNYSASAYQVTIHTDIDSLNNTAKVSLQTNAYNPEIRYTTDGSEPTATSTLYKESFNVRAPGTIRAASFRNGKRLAKTNSRSLLAR